MRATVLGSKCLVCKLRKTRNIRTAGTPIHMLAIFDITATHDDVLFTALKMTSPYAL